MVGYLFYTIGDLTYQSPLVNLLKHRTNSTTLKNVLYVNKV